MSYSNEFLQNFRPIFFSILKTKELLPGYVELVVIDEESGACSMFEPADVLDVLHQLAGDLNFLIIYTERPAYFKKFTETMYEENGLIVTLFSKKRLKYLHAGNRQKLVLDFEWNGKCHVEQSGHGIHYVPIHKKPWERAENLDIMVPIGYNTVIVKSMQKKQGELERDRFEKAFYGL